MDPLQVAYSEVCTVDVEAQGVGPSQNHQLMALGNHSLIKVSKQQSQVPTSNQ